MYKTAWNNLCTHYYKAGVGYSGVVPHQSDRPPHCAPHPQIQGYISDMPHLKKLIFLLKVFINIRLYKSTRCLSDMNICITSKIKNVFAQILIY